MRECAEDTRPPLARQTNSALFFLLSPPPPTGHWPPSSKWASTPWRAARSSSHVVPRPGATPRGQIGGGALKDFALTLDSKSRRIQLARP